MKYTKKINDTYKISAILFSKQNQYYAQNHFRVNALPETKIRIQVCNTLHITNGFDVLAKLLGQYISTICKKIYFFC